MKKFLGLFFAFILCTSGAFSNTEHDTYLSVTEINYNEQESSMQIVSRVFIDDLENVLKMRYQQEVSLGYEEDLEAHSSLISRYLEAKLNLWVNGKQVRLKYLGGKFDADQVVMFIEISGVKEPRQVKVENLILTDLFDSQKNIVHVKKGDRIESMLLMKEKGSKTVKF